MQAADSAKAFNRQLRATVQALGARGTADQLHAFICECGCGELAMTTIADYDEHDGAWLEGHKPA